MNPELTPAIWAELQAELQARRENLRQTIITLRVSENEDATVSTDPDDDAPGDRGDASVDLEEFDEDHQEELDLDDQLAEVVHALSKFAAGTYGLCEQCGKPIPLARLRALPAARYDIAHEREAESQA